MKSTPRFVLNAPPDPYGIAIVKGAEFHHMHAVMRLREGAPVELIDPGGREYEGIIAGYERDRAIVRVGAAAPIQESDRIILAAAIVKGPRMDFLVEKAAELGTAELWPIQCARGVVKGWGEARLARWRRLALAAAKQCHASRPMKVREPLEFSQLVSAVDPDTIPVICTIGAEPLAGVIRRTPHRAILIACGPEGDFDDTERATAIGAAFIPAGLGVNRLRSETAAIAAVSIASGTIAAIGAPAEVR